MLPDFLCIGAQKAGTTWLYHNLAQHPGIWMPPLKELFYFCGFDSDAEGVPRPASRWPLALQALAPRNTALRRLVGDAARKVRARRGGDAGGGVGDGVAAATPDAPGATGGVSEGARGGGLGWWLRYALMPRTDRWYARLFDPGPGQIAGDITPYYANLEADRVARIAALLPRAKVIYLLRDPIERVWSEAKMNAGWLGIDLQDGEPERVRRYFRGRHAARLTDYLTNLRTWQAHYGDGAFFVGYFDQLARQPAALARSVFEFLGVDASDAVVPPDVDTVRNAGRRAPIPEQWAAFLSELFLPRLRALHDALGAEETARWLAYAEEHAPRD